MKSEFFVSRADTGSGGGAWDWKILDVDKNVQQKPYGDEPVLVSTKTGKAKVSLFMKEEQYARVQYLVTAIEGTVRVKEYGYTEKHSPNVVTLEAEE